MQQLYWKAVAITVAFVVIGGAISFFFGGTSARPERSSSATTGLSSIQAIADDDRTIERIGNWHIDIHPNLKNGCSAGVGAYDNNGKIISIHIGYDLRKFVSPTQEGLFLTFSSKDWSFPTSAIHPFQLYFDPKPIIFNGNANSFVNGSGWTGLWITFSNNQMADKYYEDIFSNSKAMHFKFDEVQFPTIELNYIREVMTRLRTCQNSAVQQIENEQRQNVIPDPKSIPGVESCSKYFNSPYQLRSGFYATCTDTNEKGETVECSVQDDGIFLSKKCP